MIKKNLFYNIIYQLLIFLLPLITSPYISRVLGSEGIGKYSYSSTIANYFLLFCMLGINNYGNRQIAMSRHDKYELRKTFWNIYTVQIVMTVFSSGAYFVYILMGWPIDIKLAYVQFLSLISAFLDINWLFFGLEQFKLTVSRNIIIKLGSTILIFLCVKQPEDLALYTLIQCGSVVISNVYIWVIAIREVPFIRPSWKVICIHIKPILVYFIPVIAVSLYKYMDKVMIQLLGNSQELGFYENCERIIVVVSGLVNALGTVMLPRISFLVSEKKFEESERLLSISLRIVIIGSITISCGIISIASIFAPLFWGNDFANCGLLLSILALTIFPNSLGCILRTQYLIPYKQDKVYIVSVFLGAIINIIFNIILIPQYGAVGASIGTVFAEYAVMLYQKHRISCKISLSFKGLVPTSIIGIFMIIIVKITISLFDTQTYVALFTGVFIGGIYFVIAHGLYSLKFEKELLKLLINKKNFRRKYER